MSVFRGKKYKESIKEIDKSMLYEPAEALALVEKVACIGIFLCSTVFIV